MNVTLLMTENNTRNNSITLNPQQFAYVVRSTQINGNPVQTDDDFKRSIRQVSENCKICCKASQRPDVCLPMAKSFQECIAMGIEF